MIDETTRDILTNLQDDARMSNAELARRVGLAPSAVFERLRKLEERGTIRGYSVSIDPESVALALLAFVFVRSDERLGAPQTESALAAMPEVQEVHHVAGEDCFLIKVRVRDTAALSDLLDNRIGALEHVRSTRTTIVLKTAKESGALPIGGQQEEQSDAAA